MHSQQQWNTTVGFLLGFSKFTARLAECCCLGIELGLSEFTARTEHYCLGILSGLLNIAVADLE